MSEKSKTKGYAIRVEFQTLKEGARAPKVWAEVPRLVVSQIIEMSKSQEVEYVEVVSDGMCLLAAFAPRDVQAVANLIQGRAPRLAEFLREQTDSRLAEEIRILMGETPTEAAAYRK